jgi:hypothetical protein
VFRVVKLKPRQTAELWRWSRWRGDWKLIEERP